MERRNGLRQRITQRFRVAPILTTSVTGVALAAIVCLFIFLWGNFGNNKNAIAGKTTISANIAASSSFNTANSNESDTSDIIVSANAEPEIPLIPSNIQVNGVTYSSANLKWKAASGSSFYKLRISPAGQNQWTYIIVKNRQKKLDNLIENAYYNFQVQAYSKTDSSGWSEMQTFKTVYSCNFLDNLSTGTITSSTAMVHWTGDPNILNYAVRYREQGQSDWSDEFVVNTHSNRFLFTSLKPGISYEWQIRCQCPYGDNNWSEYQAANFNTLDAAEAAINNTDVSPVISNQIKVSPNPNNGQFLVELNFGKVEVKTARMELTNLSGQVLLKQNLNVENNVLSESMNVGSNLPQGFYLLKVSAGSNTYQTQISLNKE